MVDLHLNWAPVRGKKRLGSVQAMFAGNSETGLVAFATVLAMHKIAVDPEQLRHELGHERPLIADDILRLAKRQAGVRAKVIHTDFARLSRLPLPVMADGPSGWFVIGRIAGRWISASGIRLKSLPPMDLKIFGPAK